MLIAPEQIAAAAARLEGVIRATPTGTAASLSKLVGRRVLAKPEHLQRTGSFKIRGAYNRISTLAEQSVTEVVAASAGNHAQGVALASSLCGVQAQIFMPMGASLPKMEATRAYGATIELVGETVDDAMVAARRYAADTGAYYVPPFDDELVLAGQGTIGLEIADEAPDAEVVIVPVGGGGLLAGVAAGLAAKGSTARVVGVEAAGAASMLTALRKGVPVALETVDTMADGIAVRCVCELTLEHAKAYVDEVVTVDEEEIAKAVLLLLERCKWVVEPAGAVALAALLAGRIPGAGTAVVVLSGGNVDPLLLTRIIEHGLSAAGRYLMVRAVIPDRPGSLAALTTAIGQLGLNLLTVEHRRFGAKVGISEVEVILTLEARDPGHRDLVVPALRARGFRAEPHR